MAMNEPPDNYVHGHHESVLRSHTWRTIDNSAAYLAPHLSAGQQVLDVGCGPGTITVELAQRVAPGEVLGIDPSADVVAKATAHVESSDTANCSIRVGDVYALDAPDHTFDVVHAHQVLQHLRDPVAALTEMRRVARPGGLVAVRDADYGAFTWHPADQRLDTWLDKYHRITEAYEVNADAGRHLAGWCRAAGFTQIQVTASAWVFATPDERAWWGRLWADRVRESSYAVEARKHGIASQAELDDIADAFTQWIDQADATFLVPHVEVIAIA